MRKFKFPIWAFMLTVALIALGFAALRDPDEIWASVIFTLTVVALGVALVLVPATTGRKRSACLAFAVAGWVYLAFTFGPMPSSRLVNPPPLIFSTLVAKGLEYLETKLPPGPATPGNSTASPVTVRYYQVATKVRTVSTRINVTSPNAEHLHQIGHSIATLGFALLAGTIILVIPTAKHRTSLGPEMPQ